MNDMTWQTSCNPTAQFLARARKFTKTLYNMRVIMQATIHHGPPSPRADTAVSGGAEAAIFR
eukprot:2748530-Karenia_brevis.AAC.1